MNRTEYENAIFQAVSNQDIPISMILEPTQEKIPKSAKIYYLK